MALHNFHQDIDFARENIVKRTDLLKKGVADQKRLKTFFQVA